MKLLNLLIISASALSLAACGAKTASGNGGDVQSQIKAEVQFNADSAYSFVAQQCQFGPRVPGTEAHSKCGDWIKGKLKSYCNQVIEQNPTLTTFDGHKFTGRNFVGVFNPKAEQRLLFVAHWDCRPWADNDPDSTKRKEPVMGANDGASGVAVLLEVARLFRDKQPKIGIDILFTDLEDWGTEQKEDSWALGTQYWVRNPHVNGYHPMYGVLLDMVGASGATFQQEIISLQMAGPIVNEVWNTAILSGYTNFFKTTQGGAVTDDHLYINKAGIACIDVIDLRQGTESGFFNGWHTTHDTIDQIDRATLKAVGQTVCNLAFTY